MVRLAKPNGWVCAIDADLCTLSAADPGHRDANRFDEVCQKGGAYEPDRYNINYLRQKSLQVVRGGRPRRPNQLRLDERGTRRKSSGRVLASILESFRAKDDGRRGDLTEEYELYL